MYTRRLFLPEDDALRSSPSPFSIPFRVWLFVVAAPVLAGDEAPALTSIEMAERLGASEIVEYTCPRNTTCHVRCAAVERDSEPFEYDDIRRLEIAMGPEHWLVVTAWVDSVGKGHRSTGMLAVPVSCVMDDLAVDRVSRIDNGEIVRPARQEDVIFDVQPQSR